MKCLCTGTRYASGKYATSVHVTSNRGTYPRHACINESSRLLRSSTLGLHTCMAVPANDYSRHGMSLTDGATSGVS
ncbi:hypothetical protein [uncultured Muribaculum sp.]|uniref:hypothetical protein n=1 Tax=uncultured Muribaculum sp. TaxID=1918613 RepID=UPI00266FFDA9|nr:hypothetical protein [uncultured Muribaculum sp.]